VRYRLVSRIDSCCFLYDLVLFSVYFDTTDIAYFHFFTVLPCFPFQPTQYRLEGSSAVNILYLQDMRAYNQYTISWATLRTDSCGARAGGG
jgi:hypothetical protein